MSRLSEHGAWVPWSVVERLAKLRLRPASRWQVLVLLVATSCRYGRKEVRRSVEEIAEATGLSTRTVRDSIRDLIAAGHVRRTARYRRLVVVMVSPPATPPEEVELVVPSER